MAKAAMKTNFITLEIFIVLASLVFSPVATTLEWFDASDSAALCNDFTRAGYFLRRVNTSDKWIIHLESGGVCYSNETCNRRFFAPAVSSGFNRPVTSQPEFYEIYYGNFDPAEAWRETVQSETEAAVDVVSPLMTSMRCFENKTDYFPRGLSVNGTDILDSDCELNPLFCDYNHVVVPYCSSDIWLGTEIDGVRNNTAASRECTQCFDYNEENGCFRYNPQSESIQFTYRGRTIFMSVIRDLLAMGMDGAAEVVLAGSSAGGLGALNNAKWLQSELQSVGSAELIVIFDSAWLINFQGNIYREFDGTISRSESEAQRQNVLTLLSLLGSDKACSDVRLGYPCCFSPHCLLTQRNAAGVRYYPEIPTFGIFSLYDVYLLAPSLAGLETLQNEGEISIGYGIDFLLTVGEYGGEMNNTVITTAAQANFFSYYATQCFQHVYLATSTLWGEPGSTVFGGASVELQRDIASFRLSVEADIWRSLQLAGLSIQDALTQWYYNRNETIFFRDNCGGPHCNTQCPERFMLAELNTNNWPLGAKVLVTCIVVATTAVCGILKILFYIWKCHLTIKLNKACKQMDEAGDHEDLKYLIEDQGKCQSVLECKNLSYSVKSTRIFSAERLKDVNQDSVPYRVLDEVIPQLRRTVTESPTYENISKQLVLKKVDCLRVGGLGEQLRVPRNKREAIQRENPDDQAGQTRATVKYWLDVDPTPYPWRRLVTALEESSDEHKAVKSVKQYVEPLTDPSLTAKKVYSVLSTLKAWERVCDVLCLPRHRKDLIEKRHLVRTQQTQWTQRTQAAVNWWLRYSSNASWSWLAGQLYRYEEEEALKIVKQYILKDSTDTEFETELLRTLAVGTKWWDDGQCSLLPEPPIITFSDSRGQGMRLGLCQYLQVPLSVEQDIRRQTADHTKQKKAVLKKWLRDHPAPSWAVVAEALYMNGDHGACEQVKVYIRDFPPTFENTSKYLKEVDCLKHHGLGEQLRVPRKKLDEIKRQSQNAQASQTQEIVEYWRSVDPTPSWRRLVTALENCDECKVAKCVAPYVKPLTDRSLNLENVSRVMKTLKDWKRICDVLSVPDSRKKKIQSMTERRQEVVEWWLKFSPNASWNWLAGRLHFLEERTALKAVRKYIHKETEETLTPSNLYHVLDGVVKDDWWSSHIGLRQYLHIPNSVKEKILQNSQHAELQQCRLDVPGLPVGKIQRDWTQDHINKIFLESWLQDHPAPSWALVKEALYMNGDHDACKQVEMYITTGRPLTTEDISKLLEGVNCLKDGGLGEQLRVPRDTLNKIKTKYPNDQAEQAEQTRATVDSWLSVDCCYSWRRLVTALENIELPNSEERKAINSVKLHVEPLKEPSLTVENVSDVLEKLRVRWPAWGSMYEVLNVPSFRESENTRLYLDDTELKEAAVNWWLDYSPNASWSWLAGQLHLFEQQASLNAVSPYIANETRDFTLTPTNLWRTLAGVPVRDWWGDKGLRGHLQVPASEEQKIRKASDATPAQQKKILLKTWLKDHPAASWAVVKEALYNMEQHDTRQKLNIYIAEKAKEKMILDDISTSFEPNVLSAVMGPSGSGKTTFLDLLTGRRDTDPSCLDGKICIGDKDIAGSETRKWYIENSSYVLQLATPYYEELTVLENLTFAAEIKLSGQTNKLDRVCDILELTGLCNHAHRKVGGTTGSGLSGGQKRRLLLALQLLTLPKFIFLDEPLSGLDSGSAYEVLVSLRELAHTDRTVVLTIHRPGPDLFDLFDNIVLLYKGKIAYDGKADEAMYNEFVNIVCNYYGKTKSELEGFTATQYEIIQDILGHHRMLELITKEHKRRTYHVEPEGKNGGIMSPSTNNDATSPSTNNGVSSPPASKHNYGHRIIAQLSRLAALEARASKRATGLWGIYFPLVFFTYGLILGTVYFQEMNPLLIVSGFAAYSFASSFVMFPMLNRYYLKALHIFHYEHWGASGWTHDLIIQGFCRAISLVAVPLVISTAVLYFLLINAESYNLFVFGQIVVVNLALNQTWTALLIALMCAFPFQAVHISSVIISIAGFTAGFFIPVQQIPWWYRWITFINPNYYGFSASMFLLLNGFQTDCSGTQFECFTSSGEYVLGQFNFENINPYLHMVILWIFTLFYLLLAWFSNWWRYSYTSTRKNNFQKAVRALELQIYRFITTCVRKREHPGKESDDLNQTFHVYRE